MRQSTDDERARLAAWLAKNAHRLAHRRERRAPALMRAMTDAEEEHDHARRLLWTAARKLRRIETGDDR